MNILNHALHHLQRFERNVFINYVGESNPRRLPDV